jgi:hypothetical protein
MTWNEVLQLPLGTKIRVPWWHKRFLDKQAPLYIESFMDFKQELAFRDEFGTISSSYVIAQYKIIDEWELYSPDKRSILKNKLRWFWYRLRYG